MCDLIVRLESIEKKLDKLLDKKRPAKPRASKKHDYTFHFLRLWEAYPKRVGSNPKTKAYSAYCKRTSEAEDFQKELVALDMGVKHYAAFCKATNIEPQYIMQAATFFGPDKHYENDWSIPTAPDNVPRDNEKLESFANKHGYRYAYTGETFADWRKALEELHRSKS